MPEQVGRNQRRKVNRNEVRYQRPMGISPWARNAGVDTQSGSVWVSMKPSEIKDQFSKGAGTIATVDLKTEFLFLAPLALNENIVHHWEAYESVASRIAQKVRSAVKLGSEGSALLKVGKEHLNSDKLKDLFERRGANEGASIQDYVTSAYNKVPSSRIPKIKVDTPLYYTNSDRRQIVFEFLLFNENIPGMSNQDDVLINPIKELMKFSSPDLKSNIQIEFPFMWEIKTVPNSFIHYRTCALIGVQPTWNAPYVNHRPSSCNLQLTFQDLSPLYAGTIERGSIINVISPRQSPKPNVTTSATAGTAQLTRTDGTPNIGTGSAGTGSW